MYRRLETMNFKFKYCKECGKEFIPRCGTQVYCEGPHTTYCETCGAPVTYTCSPKEKPKYCSTKCRTSGIHKRNMEKLGVKNAFDYTGDKLTRAETVKICKWCGKPFKPKGSQVYCEGPHFNTCAVCGEEFEVNPRQPRNTCSTLCASILRKSKISDVQKKCEICGKLFTPSNNTSKYCEGPHYRPCPVCGRPVEFHSIDDPVKCCSLECSKQKRLHTSLERYGTPIPCQNDEIRHKLSDSAIASEEARKQTCLERYGVEYASQDLKYRKHLSSVIQSKEFQDKMKKTCLERYGVPYAAQNRAIHSKSAITRSKLKALDGTKVDSKYEQIIYNFCLSCDIPFTYQSKSISYEYKGKIHTTHIDFEIDGILFECKGGHLLQGCFDHIGVPMSAKLDVYKKHNVIVVTDDLGSMVFGKSDSTESNGLKYLHKCPEPLIGVDIELFKDFPSFPYREDRPKCFYNVKVDGQKSSHEAFYDKKIRWDMIKNRILYSGGFIDNKSILKALNVTRTCKQPSWFPKSRAKHIIKDYCTSMTIYDLAAGWGARYDAAMECKRFYVGCDFNKELVDWHHSQGRDSIQFHDGRTFYYSKPCSVFICPPYSDPKTGRCFEDYNFEAFDERAKNLTQCDWLLYAIRNAPNASEYIMVCKVVDEGWEKFIVEDIENKSHFGSNHEYILKLSNTEGKEMLQSLQHNVDE